MAKKSSSKKQKVTFGIVAVLAVALTLTIYTNSNKKDPATTASHANAGPGLDCFDANRPPNSSCGDMNPYPCYHPTIRWGAQGSCVKHLQYYQGKIVNYNGQRGNLDWDQGVVDGIFGARTDRAVRSLQRSAGNLAVDGIVGPSTWDAYHRLCIYYNTHPKYMYGEWVKC